MNTIYQKTPEERKLLNFQNSTNSFYRTLVSHTEALISMYEDKKGYGDGLTFIIDSLKLIAAYDLDKYEELTELLSKKVDIESNES